MLIILDLWLTIRNPFFDREKRIKYYWAVVFGLVVISAIPLIDLNAILQLPDGTDSQIKHKSEATISFVTMFFYCSLINYVFVVLFFLLVVIQISRKGQSAELRRKVCIRYILYFLILFIWVFCQIEIISSTSYIIYA